MNIKDIPGQETEMLEEKLINSQMNFCISNKINN